MKNKEGKRGNREWGRKQFSFKGWPVPRRMTCSCDVSNTNGGGVTRVGRMDMGGCGSVIGVHYVKLPNIIFILG